LPLPIVLDIEMIRPGEGEIVAARRLLVLKQAQCDEI
jgi:hypothetical protein